MLLFNHYRLNRSFTSTIQRRNFSSSEKQTTAPDEPTELEKKLQTEVDSLTGQVAKLTEKNEELLVSEVQHSSLLPFDLPFLLVNIDRTSINDH